MNDMKKYKLTWREEYENPLYLAKTVADLIVLGVLGYALCVLVFSSTPYMGG